MAEYACPCGCGLRINVDRSCCTPAWHRLPEGLRRRMEASYLVARTNPGARRAAFAEVAEWLRENPGGGDG